MIKLTSLLREEPANDAFISIKDVEKFLGDKYLNWEVKSTLDTLDDFYHSEKEDHRQLAINYIEILNKVAQYAIEIGKKLNIPYVELRSIKTYLLSQTGFKFKLEEYFPFPLYVSSSPDDDATIGIMVDINGKVLEIHEGNDEATPETINMVNKLVNPTGKPVRIYASHDTRLVQKIEETGYLPKNLFVSPNKEHASSYLDLEGKRSTFTGIIDINAVSQESDIDWKTLETTKIEKFRWL